MSLATRRLLRVTVVVAGVVSRLGVFRKMYFPAGWLEV